MSFTYGAWQKLNYIYISLLTTDTSSITKSSELYGLNSRTVGMAAWTCCKPFSYSEPYLKLAASHITQEMAWDNRFK